MKAERDVERQRVERFLGTALGLASETADLRSELPSEDLIDDTFLFKLLQSCVTVSETRLDDIVEQHDDELVGVFLSPELVIRPDSFNC